MTGSAVVPAGRGAPDRARRKTEYRIRPWWPRRPRSLHRSPPRAMIPAPGPGPSRPDPRPFPGGSQIGEALNSAGSSGTGTEGAGAPTRNPGPMDDGTSRGDPR